MGQIYICRWGYVNIMPAYVAEVHKALACKETHVVARQVERARCDSGFAGKLYRTQGLLVIDIDHRKACTDLRCLCFSACAARAALRCSMIWFALQATSTFQTIISPEQ